MHSDMDTYDPEEHHTWYADVVRTMATQGELWAVWLGETWATAIDPDAEHSALFLLWPSHQDVDSALTHRKPLFESTAAAEAIPLQKWLGPYTRDLIETNAAVFLCRDCELRGVKVSAQDFRRDLAAGTSRLRLQATDLVKLEARTRRKRSEPS